MTKPDAWHPARRSAAFLGAHPCERGAHLPADTSDAPREMNFGTAPRAQQCLRAPAAIAVAQFSAYSIQGGLHAALLSSTARRRLGRTACECVRTERSRAAAGSATAAGDGGGGDLAQGHGVR